MDLDSMKYADLRSLAKELGLKANMKADKLLKAIKQHYEQEKKDKENGQEDKVQEDEKVARVDVQDRKDADRKEAASSPAVFVNTRRGRGKATKRRVTDNTTVTEDDAKMTPRAAQDDAEMNTRSTSSDAKSAKKRKMSSDEDSEKNELEPPKELQTTNSEQQADARDEPPACGETEKAPKVVKAGKIPRYQGFQQRSKAILKPVTPNFKKLHEAQFNKMESIDTYVQRKTKQIDTYRKPVKELKELSNKTKLQQPDGKAQEKKNPARATMFSPALASRKPNEEQRRHTLLSASKVPPNKAGGKDVPFRPSVLSTRRINVRFSEATRDNEFKKSLVKTPARMSACVASSTPKKQTADAEKTQNIKNSTLSAQKTPGLFIFTGNTSTSATPGMQKKPNFDLKASLSRPLTYKPHKGKLKPFGETKENPSGNKSLVSETRQESYKPHKVQSRADRRTKQVEGRKQKKEGLLGARRGLVMM